MTRRATCRVCRGPLVYHKRSFTWVHSGRIRVDHAPMPDTATIR